MGVGHGKTLGREGAPRLLRRVLVPRQCRDAAAGRARMAAPCLPNRQGAGLSVRSAVVLAAKGVLFHAIAERVAGDAEGAGGEGDVAVGLAQGADDHGALGIGEL